MNEWNGPKSSLKILIKHLLQLYMILTLLYPIFGIAHQIL